MIIVVIAMMLMILMVVVAAVVVLMMVVGNVTAFQTRFYCVTGNVNLKKIPYITQHLNAVEIKN